MTRRQTDSSLHRGFSLLELAVVLVVVSLIVGFALQALQTNTSANCYASTRIKEREIQAALERYASNNGRYPRPAPRNLTPSSPTFGVEVATTTDTSIDRTSEAAAALIGAVPVSTIGLGAGYGSDCWNNKFTYVVTENLAKTPADYNANVGAITIKAGPLGSASVTTLAAYTVISHGEQALGATPLSYSSATKRNCNNVILDANVQRIDKENCDTTNNTLYTADFNDGSAAATFYDDVIVYADKVSYNANCPAGAVSWGTGGECSATVEAGSNGSSTPVTSSGDSAYTGSGTATCANNQWTVSGGTCTLKPGSCTSQSVDWLANCHNVSPPLVNGKSSKPLANMLTNSYSGLVTVTCNNGTLTQSSASCRKVAACPAQTFNWSGCSASVPQLSDGDTLYVTNTVAGSNGNTRVTCTGGALSKSDYTCDTAGDCPVQTVTWGSCSASAGALTSGSSSTVSNTASGYTGTTSITCNDTVLTQSGATCTAANANCTSQTVTWGSGCSGTAGALSHGGSGSVTNDALNKTGTATTSCSNGTITATGSCDVGCGLQTLTWGTNCSASYSANNHGSAVSVTNTASGYVGTATANCSQGTVSLTGASCAPAEYGGYAYCWGSDVNGESGTANGATPKSIPLPSGVNRFLSLSSGGVGGSTGHSCAIGDDNNGYCWGVNGSGEIGDNTTTQRFNPTRVTLPNGVSGFTKISAGGGYSTCAIATNGKGYCWGSNKNGQLGTGDTTNSSVPVAVTLPSGVSSFTDISAGTGHPSFGGTPCAIGNDGKAYCWGYGSYGQIGDGTSSMSYVPKAVTMPSGVTSFTKIMSSAGFTCALANTSRIYCWGYSTQASTAGGGALGICITGVQSAPTTPVTDGGGVQLQFSTFAIGWAHACGLTTSGKVYCWGNNDYNQLGNSSSTSICYAVPVTVPAGVSSFSKLTSTTTANCALANTGDTYCWGDLKYIQSGAPNSVVNANQPTLFTSSSSFKFNSLSVNIPDYSYNYGTNAVCGVVLAPCAAQAISWGGGNCSTTTGLIASGSSAILSMGNGSYSGSVTATCNAGTITTSNATCVAGAGPSCALTAVPTASFSASPTDVLGCGGSC